MDGRKDCYGSRNGRKAQRTVAPNACLLYATGGSRLRSDISRDGRASELGTQRYELDRRLVLGSSESSARRRLIAAARSL